MAVVE